MALAVSLFLETLARCSRSQVCSSMMSGRLRSWRTRTRSCGVMPLISRSMANSASMRSTASIAIGALLMPREIEELAPRMRPAGGLDDRTRFAVGLVEPVEASIGVRLHQSGITCQVLLGMLAATVARIEEHRRRRIRAAERPVVAHIGPQPAGAGLALGQHRHGGVVGMDALGREDMCADHVDQRHQRCCRRADPVGERRYVEIDALAR